MIDRVVEKLCRYVKPFRSWGGAGAGTPNNLAKSPQTLIIGLQSHDLDPDIFFHDAPYGFYTISGRDGQTDGQT